MPGQLCEGEDSFHGCGVMTQFACNGSFRLKPGVRLIGEAGGGIVLRDSPLRALRVNRAGFAVLERCREGFSFGEHGDIEAGERGKSLAALLDRLCQTGLVEWLPPANHDEPFVTVVTAVYNRAREIGACLESLLSLDYPADKLEIIVVDDGSCDDTCGVVSGYDVKLISLPENRGQSAARNQGVREARGEIVAFTDSDCIAGPRWLKDLLPYFADGRNVLVGGYVASYYRESLLDRYEEVNSPLNMGEETVFGAGAESDFYVPTCNMLVRKDAYVQVGGLDEEMRVGEDVDLCWRLKEHGHRLVYVPKGVVSHKHRNRFLQGFMRRFQYGESEPVLYLNHASITKRYPRQPLGMALLVCCIAALLTQQILFIPAIVLIPLVESLFRKIRYERRMNVALTFRQVLRATLEKHYQLSLHLCRHVVRYYLLLMGLLVILFPQTACAVAGLILLPSLAQYLGKKPRLNFGIFLLFFLAEQAFYQAGVFRSCVNLRSFRPYRLVFSDVRRPAGSTMISRPQGLN
ncbi:MAG: mycofactocin biosynthesis glycosyltransferase MftF [Pseudomonadota bacterium]